MPYSAYKHSYPYNTDRETTTGYSGPIMGRNGTLRDCSINDIYDNRDLVRASIEAIISTSKYERVMRPNFGARLKDLLFEPLDDFLIEDLKENLAEVLNEQEPRIYVNGIDLQIDYDNMLVRVAIDFKFLDGYKNDTFNFILQY